MAGFSEGSGSLGSHEPTEVDVEFERMMLAADIESDGVVLPSTLSGTVSSVPRPLISEPRPQPTPRSQEPIHAHPEDNRTGQHSDWAGQPNA